MEPGFSGGPEGISMIGPYEFLQKIGSGGFASVYSARHTDTMSIVAIKAISKTKIKSQHDFKLLQREVSVMRALDHPFVAMLFEVLDDAKYFYLVLEHLENGTLLSHLSTSRHFGEDQARRFFCQLASAVKYLHVEMRIVHRDLKPENILLDKYSNLRLIDFGLSRSFAAEDPFFQTTCGSGAYIAPEILSQKGYTQAADVWSLGVLLYAMVVGSLPFGGDNVTTMAKEILTVDPVIPTTLSGDLQHLLLQLLQKDAENRITFAGISEHPWMFGFDDAKMLTPDQGFAARLKSVVHDELDQAVVFEMRTVGIETTGLLQELKAGAVSARTAAYKMLRRIRVTDELHQWQALQVKQVPIIVARKSLTVERLPVLAPMMGAPGEAGKAAATSRKLALAGLLMPRVAPMKRVRSKSRIPVDDGSPG
jgi:serine/threonine protein kinase